MSASELKDRATVLRGESAQSRGTSSPDAETPTALTAGGEGRLPRRAHNPEYAGSIPAPAIHPIEDVAAKLERLDRYDNLLRRIHVYVSACRDQLIRTRGLQTVAERFGYLGDEILLALGGERVELDPDRFLTVQQPANESMRNALGILMGIREGIPEVLRPDFKRVHELVSDALEKVEAAR